MAGKPQLQRRRRRALAESGVDDAAVAAAVTTACEAHDALYEMVKVTTSAKLSPGAFDPLAVPGGLLDALAANERTYRASRIPSAPADSNESDKQRPGDSTRGVSAAAIARAARAADEAAEFVARTVDDMMYTAIQRKMTTTMSSQRHQCVKSRKRKAQSASQKPVAKAAARAIPAGRSSCTIAGR